jgi:hypothetical protein
MRNISFALTEPQFVAKTKTVTRRLGWRFLRAGDQLMGCRKCMGLRPGESIVRLGKIQVISTIPEPLARLTADADYGHQEAILEGFPQFTGGQFVEMFCSHMKVIPQTIVTRIEFRYL